MITSHFSVNNSSCRTYRLRPFGDIQYGANGFDNELWNRYVKDVQSDPDGMTIGMGDYTDLFRPTIRGRLDGSFADDYDSEENLFDLHRKHMEKVAEMLAPVVKSGLGCLGLLDGHHFMNYTDTQMTSTQYLCLVLKDMTGKNIPYLGEMSAFVLIRFKFGKHRVSSKSFVVHAQHGEGGSVYIGTDMGKLERRTAPSFDADLYIRGHSTKLYAGGMDVLCPGQNGNGIIHRSKLLVNTGGFMRGYEGKRASYVEKKMLPPARLGWATINIRLYKCHSNYRAFDLSATV